MLLSSHQDFYAPYDSARIQPPTKAKADEEFKETKYTKMASNILSQLTCNRLVRIDVNFQIEGKNLDSFIGRTAHIQFLENQSLMKILLYAYEDLFV